MEGDLDQDLQSSAFDTDDLIHYRNQAHSIAEHGKDQTKLLLNYQKKVKELLFYRQESINLQTQLQISKETQKMMEVEFAFLKSEMESEIERRKQTENELREALISKETDSLNQTKHYDVDAFVTVEEEYKKWKKIAEDLTKQAEQMKNSNQTLTENLLNSKQELEIQNQKNKKQNQKIEEQKAVNKSLQQERDKLKQEIENLQKQLASMPSKEQFDSQQKQIQKLQNRIERRNKVIQELQSANESHGTSELLDSNLLLGSTNPSQEVERLKLRLARALKRLDALNSVEQKCSALEETLSHYDAERQVLNDIMQTEDTDPSQEWGNLREKAKQGMDAISRLEETASMLTTAEKKIAELQNSTEQINALQKKLTENDEKMLKVQSISQNLAKTESEFNVYKAETEKMRLFAEQQKIRCAFSKIVAENQQHLVTAISNLHYTITGNKEQLLRPIVLASIFCTRWYRLINRQEKKLFDPTSLVSFTSIPSHSIEAKLETIHQIFVSLSNELLKTKSALTKSNNKINKIKKQVYEMGGDFEAYNTEIQNEKMKSKVYKDRVKELNDQISLLVAPSKFEKALSRATDFELEIEKLNKIINKLKEEIDCKEDTIRENCKDKQKAEFQFQKYSSELDLLKIELGKKNEELAILKSKLQERTKDLLSLERIMNMNIPEMLPKNLLHTNISDLDSESTATNRPTIMPQFLGISE